MIRIDLARRVVAAGTAWTPASGDRFVVPDRDMDADVFVVSEMLIDVHDLPTGRVIGFNGTTEWALDSVRLHEVVWLPREEQLRRLLGASFLSLHAEAGGFAVLTDQRGTRHTHTDADAENAYALALLALLEG